MVITYKDMKERKSDLDSHFRKRINFLSESMSSLLSAYINSIGLSEQETFNYQNRDRRCVVALDPQDDKLVFKGTNTIDSNPTTFFIATILDASQKNIIYAGCNVSLKTDYDADALLVTIGDYPSQKEFEVDGGDFSDVCEAIQKLTYQNIDKFKKT